MNEFINELAGSKWFRVALTAATGLLALFLLVTTWDAAFGRSVNDSWSTITVEGTGMTSMVPDTAQIGFTVTESAGAVVTAQDAATKKVDAALAALKQLGIEEKDVKTVGYTVNPKYEYPQPCYSGVCPAVVSSPRIVGYEVSQSVSVKVRDTAKAGDVLQALGSLEVQNISGPNFVIDDEDAVKNTARKEAIEEARAKAKELAKQLGVRLGKVVSFSENGGAYPMYDAYGKGGGEADMRAMSAAPTLPTGENETSVTVMITYEIH